MNYRKLLALLVTCALCIAFALPAAADSLSIVSEPNQGTLTISYLYQDDTGNTHALNYVDFNLYCVASLDEENGLTNTDAFRDILLPEGLFADLDLLIETRNTLEHFVDTNPLTPDYVVTTNAQGKVTVDLPLGLYYIDAQIFWEDNASGETSTAYYSTPFLVLIGAYDSETGEYLYDYTAYPKVSTITLENETLMVSVKKVWENTEYTTQPEEILVSLYCDGECPATTESVALNAENNWSY
ncbi:MAG: Cna B-type domain-containing protein, partial [Faecalibacterium sp.]